MAYNKFWIAILTVVGMGVQSRYQIDFGFDQQLASDIVGGIGAALVFAIPNK